MARDPLFDRAVAAALKGAEEVVQRALVAKVEEELGRVVREARPTTYKQWIDRVEGAPISSIRHDGTAHFEFSYVGEILGYAAHILWNNAPVDTGRYEDSFEVYVNGAKVADLSAAPDARVVDPSGNPSDFLDGPEFLRDIDPKSEFVIVNAQPYSRRIEVKRRNGRPWSEQAPDGVFRISAETIARRYGNLAIVRFLWVAYDHAPGDAREPAISIEPR